MSFIIKEDKYSRKNSTELYICDNSRYWDPGGNS